MTTHRPDRDSWWVNCQHNEDRLFKSLDRLGDHGVPVRPALIMIYLGLASLIAAGVFHLFYLAYSIALPNLSSDLLFLAATMLAILAVGAGLAEGLLVIVVLIAIIAVAMTLAESIFPSLKRKPAQPE